MRPILFDANETAYISHGIGTIADATSCKVTEERNGSYELTLTLPITSRHYKELRPRCQILAKPNPYDAPQPFRIYRISKPLKGMVTAYAEHISYDLSGIPVTPFTASSATEAMQKLKLLSVTYNPFTFSTSVTRAGSMTVSVPKAIRALLGGAEGSLLDVFGGEYRFDRYSVALLQSRGADRGFTILYGKNLIDLQQEENISAVYTAVLPYYYSEQDGLVSGDLQQAPGTYDFVRILPLDLSQKWQEKPTVQQVNAAGAAYVKGNNIGIPTVSIKASFVPPGSLGLDSLEEVRLCDTVTVRFDRLGIDTQAKVVKTEYDVLRDRYTSVEIGDLRTNIAKTIVDIEDQAAEAVTSTAMENAIKSATDLITGVTGGSVMWGFDANGKPLELFFLDTDSVSTAREILRINRNGIGFSTQGINGPFDTAWTIKGEFYAKYIVAGTIVADKLANGAVTERAIDSYAVTNPKIGGAAVSYGKTSFTGTLDQVGVNKSNIEELFGYFTGSANFASLNAANFYIGGRHITPTTVPIDGTYFNLVSWSW